LAQGRARVRFRAHSLIRSFGIYRALGQPTQFGDDPQAVGSSATDRHLVTLVDTKKRID